jgi:predicted RNase H-like nuclease (RuvC/YqgF family)
MRAMTTSPDVAQATRFRDELWRHVEEISRNLELAERKEHRLSDWRHRKSHQLRAELYEAHRLIDALNNRFPTCERAYDD